MIYSNVSLRGRGRSKVFQYAFSVNHKTKRKGMKMNHKYLSNEHTWFSMAYNTITEPIEN